MPLHRCITASLPMPLALPDSEKSLWPRLRLFGASHVVRASLSSVGRCKQPEVDMFSGFTPLRLLGNTAGLIEGWTAGHCAHASPRAVREGLSQDSHVFSSLFLSLSVLTPPLGHGRLRRFRPWAPCTLWLFLRTPAQLSSGRAAWRAADVV